MTRADVDAFSRALREAFPDLRFVSQEHWKPFADWAAWHAAWEERERLEGAGLEPGPVRHRMRDPTGQLPRYWDSLADPEEDRFYGWILPNGWTPVWGEPNDFGERHIVNAPALGFMFGRGQFHTPDRRPSVETVWFDHPPEPRGEEETIVLTGCQLDASWERHDKEAAAFVAALFRILHNNAQDQVVMIESKSRRAISLVPARNRRFHLAWPDAEAWVLARRHNYLRSSLLLKPVSFSFADRDVFSPEELKAWKARRAAEFQAALAQLVTPRRKRRAPSA